MVRTLTRAASASGAPGWGWWAARPISDSTFRAVDGTDDGGAGVYHLVRRSRATATIHNNLAAGAAMVVEGGSSATVRASIIAHNGGSPAGKGAAGGGVPVRRRVCRVARHDADHLNSEIEENVAGTAAGSR